jgi:hypothetical protein
VGQHLIREQGTDSVPAYHKRVYRLAAIYAGIVVVCILAIILIVYKGKFFINLSQRSNVETLTLAFIIVLFAYLTIVSAPGFWGALRISYYNLPAWFGGNRGRVEARKQAALKPRKGDPNSVMLNTQVRLSGNGDCVVCIPLQDAAGPLGRIVLDGVEMRHEDALQDGSNSVFGYFEQRIQTLVRARDPQATVEIVQWTSIDDEQAMQYRSMVLFSRNLEKALTAGPLWPTVTLTEDDLQQLTREASALCPSLRNEAFLPDLEYSAEHQLPIIPEPLGIISLSRSESRADPVASMGCALVIAIVILAIVSAIILFPPWVPPR